MTQGLNLRDLDLRYAALSGLNLSRAKVNNSTKFNNANLCGSSLCHITRNRDPHLHGANFDDETKLDSRWLGSKEACIAAGMTYISEEENQK